MSSRAFQNTQLSQWGGLKEKRRRHRLSVPGAEHPLRPSGSITRWVPISCSPTYISCLMWYKECQDLTQKVRVKILAFIIPARSVNEIGWVPPTLQVQWTSRFVSEQHSFPSVHQSLPLLFPYHFPSVHVSPASWKRTQAKPIAQWSDTHRGPGSLADM